MTTQKLSAQEEQTEETHAHSTRRQWKGIDVNEALDNPEYATYNTVFSDEFANKDKGKKFFLYNVGTGRFVIEGGKWGMEGRLFHEDFGRPLYLLKDGFIYSGITEQSTPTKIMFGCNVPGVSKPTGTWAQLDRFWYTALMDVDYANNSKLTCWTFQRVETDPDSDTYTYYMWEAMPQNNPTNYYLGACYGEWHDPNPDGKGDGVFVNLDPDRSCWTTASVIGNQNKMDVNGDMITIDELYQWRLISEDEFITVLNEEEIGLNPSVSSLVPDRDFPRNSDTFDNYWVMEEKEGADYSTIGRRGFTWGIYFNKKTQKEYNNNSEYFLNEPWNKPVRTKPTFGKIDNARNGYLNFEGIGRTYTSFVVPKPGWYQVQCYGFVQSSANHDAYFFAKVAGSDGTTSYGGESKTNLHKVPANTFKNKNNENGCNTVGNELRVNGPNYLNTIWICVTDDQFNSGDVTLKTMQIGVGKDEATRSGKSTNSGVNCYYDTDWVCIDDIRVSYMGKGPVFFYEDEESLDYLSFDESQLGKQYLTSSPTGQYGGGACLERTFKKNQWNSFTFPLPLTGEQMRLAFGEDAKLARIHSIGKLSKNPDVIDFKSVSLKTTENVVEPEQFYLLWPTKDPVEGMDPQGRFTSFYQLGRMFFSVNETEPDTYTFPKMSLRTMKTDTQQISSYEDMNDGQASANYIQTPGYSTFTVSNGIYNGSIVTDAYAPKGAYVVSNNTIYHINKDTRLKGFRGWITLDHPIGQSSNQEAMAIYSMFYNENIEEEDGIATGVDLPLIMPLPDDTNVYDLHGRKVGTLGSNLNKGIYIVKGKKFIVK